MKHLAVALRSLLFFTLLLGVAYPLLVTGMLHTIAPSKAKGSMILENGVPAGSSLVGQDFNAPYYFWPRPSASIATPYNASGSAAANLHAASPTLLTLVQARTERLHAADPTNDLPIPADLVTSSASGLDPHISPAAAEYQAMRVARARDVPVEAVRGLIAIHTERRTLGLLGEPRVNVLQLNQSLDRMERK
jgi:K+-transporting ATPase ATPase C chain